MGLGLWQHYTQPPTTMLESLDCLRECGFNLHTISTTRMPSRYAPSRECSPLLTSVQSFNSTTSQYRIHIPPEVEARTRTGPSGSPVIQGFRTPRSTTDQKSIFVGNLPSETTEHQLKQLFSPCGMIRAVNIIHKPIHGNTLHKNQSGHS